MTTLRCPECDARFSAGEGWAKAAVSTLIAAPAVPDMATQARCPKCGHVFADSDVRYLRSNWSGRSIAALLIAAIVFITCVAYLFLGT